MAAGASRLKPLTTPSKSWSVTGCHEFTIESYSATKGLGVGVYIPSCPFSVGGHRWQICFFPDGENPRDAHAVGVYVDLLFNPPNPPTPHPNPNPIPYPSIGANQGDQVVALYGFQLLDGLGRHISKRIACTPAAFSRSHASRGFPNFMRRSDLEASPFLRNDDLLVIRCSLSVYRSYPSPAPTPTILPSTSNNHHRLRHLPALHDHLSRILHTAHGSDVTFTLTGPGDQTKSFRAHRCVLSARSPVFKEQLQLQPPPPSPTPVMIQDVDPDAFKSLLHFIYTDSLPPGETLIIQGPAKDDSILKTHRLLDAAHRYGIDKLKLFCEDTLCDNITLTTVGDTLALAERINCPRLKAVACGFMTKFATHARQSIQLKRPSSSSSSDSDSDSDSEEPPKRTPTKRLRRNRADASSSAGSLRRSARLRKRS